jgi:hypothetical protein
MALPWHDWQFWVVTVACAGGVWSIVSPFVPRRGKPKEICGGCASGAAACARKEMLERTTGVTRRSGPLVVLDDRR